MFFLDNLFIHAALQWNINLLVAESAQAREDRKKRVKKKLWFISFLIRYTARTQEAGENPFRAWRTISDATHNVLRSPICWPVVSGKCADTDSHAATADAIIYGCGYSTTRASKWAAERKSASRSRSRVGSSCNSQWTSSTGQRRGSGKKREEARV